MLMISLYEKFVPFDTVISILSKVREKIAEFVSYVNFLRFMADLNRLDWLPSPFKK